MKSLKQISLALLLVAQFSWTGFAQGPIISTVAGNGTMGFSGDGNPATSAQLKGPGGLTVDPEGNLFIADSFNDRIRKVTPNGIISTIAGNGSSGFSGDGGAAASAQLNAPSDVAADAAGNLFISDDYNNRVRKVAGEPPGKASLISPSGMISTHAPTYTWNAVATGSYYYLWVDDHSTQGRIKSWYTAEQAGCSSGTGACSITPATILSSGTAKWWIQTWNSAGYGPWSDPMSFTVAIGIPPGKATLISPSGSVATGMPTYTWNAVAGATWYWLWVNDAVTSSGKIQKWYPAAEAGCASGTGTCSVTPSTTLAAGSAKWWIQTWNEAGYGPWSDGMAFVVGGAGPPGKATLVSPTGTITTATPTYTWNAVTGSTWYLLWVGDGAGSAKINQWYTAESAGCSAGTGTCRVKPGSALASGSYQWWIQTWNDSGIGPWSEGMGFTIGSPPSRLVVFEGFYRPT
jgi:hypothetical protein